MCAYSIHTLYISYTLLNHWFYVMGKKAKELKIHFHFRQYVFCRLISHFIENCVVREKPTTNKNNNKKPTDNGWFIIIKNILWHDTSATIEWKLSVLYTCRQQWEIYREEGTSGRRAYTFFVRLNKGWLKHGWETRERCKDLFFSLYGSTLYSVHTHTHMNILYFVSYFILSFWCQPSPHHHSFFHRFFFSKKIYLSKMMGIPTKSSKSKSYFMSTIHDFICLLVAIAVKLWSNFSGDGGDSMKRKQNIMWIKPGAPESYRVVIVDIMAVAVSVVVVVVI